jgi:hypothetical protein
MPTFVRFLYLPALVGEKIRQKFGTRVAQWGLVPVTIVTCLLMATNSIWFMLAGFWFLAFYFLGADPRFKAEI